MAYKVIKAFSDGQDGMYVYNEGDTYPRNGYVPSKDRLNGLLGTNNKQGVPLIEDTTPKKVKEPVEVPAEEPKKAKKKGK